MTKPSTFFQSWAKSPGRKKEYKLDLFKRKISKLSGYFAYIFLALAILSMIIMMLIFGMNFKLFDNTLPLNTLFSRIFIGFFAIFFLFAIVLIYSSIYNLSKKEFHIYSFYILSERMKQGDLSNKRGKKEILNLITLLKKDFNPIELVEIKNFFQLDKSLELRKELRNILIFIENKIVNGKDDGTLSEFLMRLGYIIYEEENIDNIIDFIRKKHKGEGIVESPGKMKIFFSTYRKKILALFLTILVIIVSIVLDISKETLFVVMGGTIVGGIILYLIISK